MNSKMLLAGMLLTAGSVAQASVTLPAICKSAANYAAQSLDLGFSDGSFADPYNPSKVTLKRNLVAFPVTAVTDLGNCEENPKLKPSWCQVAGGSPEVYRVQVGQASGGSTYPFATAIVTYNRGGCWVDEIAKK